MENTNENTNQDPKILTVVETTISIYPRKWERIEITNSTDEKSDEWHASYIDYDGNVGAVTSFPSKQAALENWQAWLPLAREVYMQKLAKHGEMPVFIWDNGTFTRFVRKEPNRLIDWEFL